MTARTNSGSPRYEPHERPPPATGLSLALQGALLSVPPMVLLPLVAVQAAGGSESLASWVVFVSLAATGATMVLQTMRFGIVGSGCHIAAVPSAVAIPFCALALMEGGPKTLAALVLFSGLFSFAIAMRLSLLRRIFSPTVIGTFNILLVVTIILVILENMGDLPDGGLSTAGLACAAITLLSTLAFVLRGPGFWRVWGPVFGLALGSAAAAAFGILEPGPLHRALWAGVPVEGWAGPGFDFGSAFWTLLPAFLFISALTVVQANSLSFVAQRVSWRDSRATDFRAVQGGVVGTCLGNILSGLGGGMPVNASVRGSLFVQQTACASRDVGILVGALLLVLAFFPKGWALLLVIPIPVMAAYMAVILAPMFIEGMKSILQDEPDYSKSVVVGVSLLVGLGFHFGLIDLPIGGLWESTLQKAVTSGGIVIILLTWVLELTSSRRRRLQVMLDIEELPRINRFLAGFSSGRGWGERMTGRLQAASEEALLVLLDLREAGRQRQLRLIASGSGRGAELEFATAPSDSGNLEDQLSLLSDPPPEIEEMLSEGDVPLRMLRHFATSVSHRQYHETEIITIHVALVTEQ